MKLSALLEKKTAKTVWVVVYTKDKLILGKRSPTTKNPNQWNFFGGHVDEGEASIDAVRRELGEETGLKLAKSAFRKIATIDGNDYFGAELDSFSGMNSTTEISDIKRFKLTDLPDNLHSKTAAFFDSLSDILR